MSTLYLSILFLHVVPVLSCGGEDCRVQIFSEKEKVIDDTPDFSCYACKTVCYCTCLCLC